MNSNRHENINVIVTSQRNYPPLILSIPSPTSRSITLPNYYVANTRYSFMLLSKHYNKNSFIKHICYHCNKWYGFIISQTSQIFTSHTMAYIVKNNCSSVQIHWEYFRGRVIPNVQKKTCSMMTKRCLFFVFLKEKKKIPISGNSSPIFESLLVPEKKKKTLFYKKAAWWSLITQCRQGSTEGRGQFPEMWLASIPKVIWCWSKDLRELWS